MAEKSNKASLKSKPVKVLHVRKELEKPIVTTELAIAKIYPYDLKGIYRKRERGRM